MKKGGLWGCLMLSIIVVGYFLFASSLLTNKDDNLVVNVVSDTSSNNITDIEALEMPVFEIFTENSAPIESKRELVRLKKLTKLNLNLRQIR